MGATTNSPRSGASTTFARAVPINTYEELRPYVDAVANGTDPHALTADPVEMFTNTSGTTSKPKLVPVTASSRAAERRVKNAWLAYLAADAPGRVARQGLLPVQQRRGVPHALRPLGRQQRRV